MVLSIYPAGQVVEKIRAGNGKDKRLLVIDNETEKEMAKRVSIITNIIMMI